MKYNKIKMEARKNPKDVVKMDINKKKLTKQMPKKPKKTQKRKIQPFMYDSNLRELKRDVPITNTLPRSKIPLHFETRFHLMALRTVEMVLSVCDTINLSCSSLVAIPSVVPSHQQKRKLAVLPPNFETEYVRKKTLSWRHFQRD